MGAQRGLEPGPADPAVLKPPQVLEVSVGHGPDNLHAVPEGNLV